MDAVLNPYGLFLALLGFLALGSLSGNTPFSKLAARLLGRLWMRWRSPFGRSDWAGWRAIHRKGMTKPGGLFLGRWQRWSRATFLYRHGEAHLLTVAGSGAGKTTGLVVPALCELTEGSVSVIDPKAQLAAMTHRHRATQGAVIFINPWAADLSGAGIDLPDNGFNPLSILEDNYNLKDDAERLARYLLVTDRQDSNSYWNSEAEALLAAFIVWMVKKEAPENRTLSFLYDMVRDGIVQVGIDKKGRPILRDNMRERLKWFVERGGTSYLKKEGEKYYTLYTAAPAQWQGVISKAQIATKPYAPGTPLGDHTARNGFDLRRLKRENVTVYVIAPTERLRIAAPWMNMLMSVFGQAIGRPGPAWPVYLMMDEAPALGYLPDLRNHLRENREAGLRAWIFTQTRSALSDPTLYGENGFKDIFALCETKMFFGIDDLDLARDLSAMLGEKTELNRSRNDADRENASLVGVPLVRPEEILRLRRGHMVIVRSGMKPIKAQLVPYWKRAKWQAMIDKNPYR